MEELDSIVVTIMGGIGVISLLSFALFVWALVDLLKSKFEGNGKIIWLIVIILLPVVGSIIYLVVGRKQKVT